MANMDMSKHIVEITLYQVTQSSDLFPLSETLQEIGETYLFSYENGVGLQRIDDPDRVKRRGHKNRSCAGLFITECPLASNFGESFFFISPGHPKEFCYNRKSDGYGYWRTLAFEDDGTGCLLDHIGPSSNLIYNFRATNVSSWANLFVQTAHVRHSTDETRKNPAVLSGQPEILWGLVALNVGNDIGNLGAYVTFREHKINLAWCPGSQPDRTPARVLAVTIYHNEYEQLHFV